MTIPAARVAGALLDRLAGGAFAHLPLTLSFWDGSARPAGETPALGTVLVRRRAIAQLVREPNQLGLVRAVVSGDLELDGDLEAVLALRARLRGVHLSPTDRARAFAAALALGGRDALRRPPVPSAELQPSGRRHSRARDRRVVRHHYDVSNAFYRLVLGPSLVYSCAYFADPSEPLEAAQERKLERICRKLRLEAGDRLLDIGCGWGSLLIHAAARHGARGVGITLSAEQAALARERVLAAGVADRVEIRVADYREVRDGPFDKVASVGMVEHVGADQLDGYAATVARLLRPGGLVLNHGVAQLFSTPAGEKSLIQRYVFPDGELPPLARVVAAVQRAGLEPRDVEALREHYVLTLRAWADNLAAGRETAVAEVGAERERVWRMYLLASMVAFADADISVFQLVAAKPGGEHGLPLVRGDLAAQAAGSTAGVRSEATSATISSERRRAS